MEKDRSAKDAWDRFLLCRRVQMPVSASLLFGLVPDEIIDEPLIRQRCWQRSKQKVSAAQQRNPPLTYLSQPR
jgi:hypothetical protein